MRYPRRPCLTTRAVAAAAAICTGVTGCRPPSVVDVSSSTTSPEAEDVERLAALLEAADTRRPDTIVIDRGLRSADARVRASVLRTIGQVRIHARVPALRLGLRDADSLVAADAAFALGLLRDTASVVGVGAALVRPAMVADAAAWALGEMGEPARAVLGSVLRAGQPPAALAAALQAAAKLRPIPTPDVVPYLGDGDAAVRRSAAYAVTRSRVPAAVRPILSIATRLPPLSRSGPSTAAREQVEVEFRSHLARGLAHAFTGDSLAEPALLPLGRLVDDPHPHVRVNAVRALTTCGEAARARLQQRLHDPDASVPITVARSLTGVLAVESDDWVTAWEADTGFTYRRSLLATATRSGVRLPALVSNGPDAWHRHPDWAYALEAGVALAAWRRAVADSENDARVAALGVVEAAWATDSLAFTAAFRDSLAALAPPADPVERAVRRIVLPELGGRPLRASIATDRGLIEAVLYGADAPLTGAYFVALARRG